MTITNRGIALRPVLAALLLMLAGCGGGEDVTPQTIARARGVWQQAGIRNYDLEWVTSGANQSRYRVEVRGGQVRSIEQVLPDGRVIQAHPADPQYFGIEGLFTTITAEHAQLRMPTPFGQRKGTKAVLRFTPDPKYGFPRSYHRDVLGSPMALGIDVVRFDPDPRPRTASTPSS